MADGDSDLGAVYEAASDQKNMPSDDKKHVVVYTLVQPTSEQFYGLVGPNGLMAYAASSAETVLNALKSEAADPNVVSIYIDVSGVDDSSARGTILSLKNAAVGNADESVKKIYIKDREAAFLFERAREPISVDDEKPVRSEARAVGGKFEQILRFRNLIVRFTAATLDGLSTFVNRVLEKINAAILRNDGKLSLVGAINAARHELKDANVDIDIASEQAKNRQVVERKTQRTRENRG